MAASIRRWKYGGHQLLRAHLPLFLHFQTTSAAPVMARYLFILVSLSFDLALFCSYLTKNDMLQDVFHVKLILLVFFTRFEKDHELAPFPNYAFER